jgi:hypothetical protein
LGNVLPLEIKNVWAIAVGPAFIVDEGRVIVAEAKGSRFDGDIGRIRAVFRVFPMDLVFDLRLLDAAFR